MAAIDKEIVDLLKKGAIEVCLHTPGEFVSNIFTVPKKSSASLWSNYPFQNGRHIPAKIHPQKGDFMTKLDLRDTYLTVPVEKRWRIYL